MKFSIEKKNFIDTLGSAQSVVERRNTIPILNNIMVEAKSGILSITGTDMNIAIFASTEIQSASDGSTTIPAGPLFDIIKKLPEGAQISVELDDNNILISAGRSQFKLPSLPADEFPVMTGGEMPFSFEIGSNELRDLIENTRFAISNEETRYYLNGIYFHEIDGVLRAVATDGHRLAKAETPAPPASKGMPGIIVPKKAINELYKLLEQTDSDVQVNLSENRIKFQLNSTTITTKLVDGTFPDYKRVIPQGNDIKLRVNCNLFSEAVERVATLSDSKMAPIKVTVSNGMLKLFASTPQLGTASDEVEIVYAGKELEIGFNARYLSDIANQIKNSDMIFELKDSSSPSIIKNTDNKNALYVLMPMRV